MDVALVRSVVRLPERLRPNILQQPQAPCLGEPLDQATDFIRLPLGRYGVHLRAANAASPRAAE
eukprot:2259146-Pyramimonas_sp.AAC.1